jgi:protein O-mannosyl-transferase
LWFLRSLITAFSFRSTLKHLRGSRFVQHLVVAATALALYGRTLGYGFSYVDDDVLIIDAQGSLSQPSSVWRAFSRPYFSAAGRDHSYYRPVVNASFAFDAQLSGNSPVGYRVTNLVLHAMAACLLLLLLLQLGHGGGIALFGALLFAVHPALTEAVAWIPGRNDSLLSVWLLAAWLLVMPARDRGRWGLRAGHLAAWLLALLSKEAALVLPVALVAHARLVERRPWREMVPPWLFAGWALVIAIYAVARTAVATEGSGIADLVIARESFLRAPSVLLGSLGKLVIPVHLSVLAIPEDTWLWPGVVALILFLGALRLPGLQRRRLLFTLVCLIVFMAPGLPASGLLTLENRLYLPAIAAMLAAAEVAAIIRTARSVRIAGASLLLVLFATRAFVYSGDFRDRMTFALAATRESPHSSLAHRNLGVAYQLQGDLEGARREYEAALSQDAGEPVAHNNLGVILMGRGQLAEAEQNLEQELAINPHYAQAHRNLALVLRAVGGRQDEAAFHWEASLGIGAADVEALRELVDYYGPRDPARAAHFQSLLEVRRAADSKKPGT